jgi:hypothetical protein
MKLKFITPLLAAGAAAVAIAAAPTAFAANQQTCSGTVCQSPGNVQIKTATFSTTPTEEQTRAGCCSTTKQLSLRRTRVWRSCR